MENRIEFIKEMETFCRKCRALEDLVIERGYVAYHFDRPELEQKEFVKTNGEIPVGNDECICIRWKDQSPKFGIIQPINGDSCYGILIDAMKHITRIG